MLKPIVNQFNYLRVSVGGVRYTKKYVYSVYRYTILGRRDVEIRNYLHD